MVKQLRSMVLFLFAVVFAAFTGSAVQADMKEMKAYKEAFPEAKVKCIDCHTEAIPKKDDGQHELNDYGKAVMAQAQKDADAAAVKEEVMPTVATYQKVGKIEEFKK